MRVLIATLLVALAGATDALAHGDPASHYLEGDLLYPAVASRPSPALELRLIGLLRAAERAGYPVKVALVASVDDLAEDPGMLRQPQAYSEFVSWQLGGDGVLRAPLLVVTPYGLGVSGRQLLGGRLRPVTRTDAQRLVRGIALPPHAQRDALARAALAAVRRIARAGGRRLPAHVAPASPVWTGPSSVSGDASGRGVQSSVAVFAAVFLGSLLLFDVGIRIARRRRLASEPATNGARALRMRRRTGR